MGVGVVLLMFVLMIGIICYFITVQGLLVKKAGENPWKILIPVYGGYLQYDLFYDGSMFWVQFILGIVVSALSSFLPAIASGILSLISSIVLLIIQIRYCISLAHSFNKSGGFAVGLIFLYPIFASILAFSNAQYGNSESSVSQSGAYGWRCGCGNMNSPNAVFCDRCGKDRTTHQ